MKKKTIIEILIILFMCVIIRLIYSEYRKSYVKESPEQMLAKIFEITENMCDYEIVDVENKLLRFDYGGTYKVVLDVNEEKIDKLIQYFDKNYREVFPEKDDEWIEPYGIKNFTGIEYNENQKVYELEKSMECLRKVEDSSTTYRMKHLPYMVVVCYPATEGKCRIHLNYYE